MDKFGAIQRENEKSLRRKGLSERDAVLVSLKNKAKKSQRNTVGPISSGEKFPYGMRMHLEGKHVKALGLHKAKAGQKVHIKGKAHVVSVSKDDRMDGSPSHRVEIQVTHMAPMATKGYVKSDSAQDTDGEDQD